MKCEECGREVEVVLMCPICKKFLCKDHISPNSHECSPKSSLRSPRNYRFRRDRIVLSGIERARKALVSIVLCLIIADQVLRIAARLSYSLALEANLYAFLISLITNHFVSPLILLFALLTPVFLLEKKIVKVLSEGTQRKIYIYYFLAFAVYVTIITILLPGILNWIVLLL